MPKQITKVHPRLMKQTQHQNTQLHHSAQSPECHPMEKITLQATDHRRIHNKISLQNKNAQQHTVEST